MSTSTHVPVFEQLRAHPERCFRALDAAHDLPWIDYASIRPFELDPSKIRDGLDRANEHLPLLAWEAQVVFGDRNEHRERLLLLVDVLVRHDPRHALCWPSLRAQVRMTQGCPTWLAVALTHADQLEPLRRAFDHEPTLLPVVIDAEGALLAKPIKPPARPPMPLLV